MLYDFYPQSVLTQRRSAPTPHRTTSVPYPMRTIRLYIALIIAISLGLIGQSIAIQEETMSSVAAAIDLSQPSHGGWHKE